MISITRLLLLTLSIFLWTLSSSVCRPHSSLILRLETFDMISFVRCSNLVCILNLASGTMLLIKSRILIALSWFRKNTGSRTATSNIPISLIFRSSNSTTSKSFWLMFPFGLLKAQKLHLKTQPRWVCHLMKLSPFINSRISGRANGEFSTVGLLLRFHFRLVLLSYIPPWLQVSLA